MRQYPRISRLSSSVSGALEITRQHYLRP